MIYKIDEEVEIIANGERILLEKGDEVNLPGVTPDPKDKLPGGYADDETVQSIAAKHGVSVESILKQLEMGIEVELEHTNDRDIAREIALDHLFELPDYYTRLKNMEKEAENANQDNRPLHKRSSQHTQ